MIQERLNKWVSQEYEWLRKEITTNIAWGRMSEYAEDLLHHIIMDLYKMEEGKLEKLLDNGKLKWYVLSGAGLQLRSGTSPFYKIHRKDRMSARSGMLDEYNKVTQPEVFKDEEAEELMDCFNRAVEQLDWYHKELFTKKFKSGWSFQEMHDHYNISKRHLTKDINKAINQIRSICDGAE